MAIPSHKTLALFAITDEETLELADWVKTTTDDGALEALYELLGGAELCIAYLIHAVEARSKDLAIDHY